MRFNQSYVLARKDATIAVCIWLAPGPADTELGVLMELEVGHGERKAYAGVLGVKLYD